MGTVCRAHRTRGIGPTLRPSRFFLHAHPDQTAALVFDGDIAWVVVAREKPRYPVAVQPCVSAHGRNCAIGHGGRAERAALHLRLHQVARGSRHVGAGDGAAVDANPRSGVIAPRRNALRTRMPGTVEISRADPFTLILHTPPPRGIAVGEARVLEVLLRA